MRSHDILPSTLLFAAAASAFSWQDFTGAKRGLAHIFDRRAAATSFDLSYSAIEGQTSSAAATSGGSSNGQGTGNSSGTQSGTNTSSPPKTTVFDPRLPAGGVQMITPSAIAGPQYYKIGNGEFVTFAWNYTSVSIMPTAVDILASCSQNQATYTIAMNQSVTGPTGEVIWDTGAYQSSATVPLLTETYTLIIHDAAKDVSSTPQAGYLDTYNQFTFGMYTPQPYIPMDEWVCATCSGALSLHEKQTLGFMLGMVTITILSFTWFAGLTGLW